MENLTQRIKYLADWYVQLGITSSVWVADKVRQDWETRHNLRGLYQNYTFPEGLSAGDIHKFVVETRLLLAFSSPESTIGCAFPHRDAQMVPAIQAMGLHLPQIRLALEQFYKTALPELWTTLKKLNPVLNGVIVDEGSEHELYETLLVATEYSPVDEINNMIRRVVHQEKDFKSPHYQTLKKEVEAQTEEFNFAPSYKTLLKLKAQLDARKPQPEPKPGP